ncbi:MAG: hypothetical protein ACFE8B_13560, partial [Candidatus Hermodarchaeota archaeon]
MRRLLSSELYKNLKKKRVKKNMGVILKISLRNMKRRKLRYILTTLTLVISVALFGGVMIVSDSFNEMMLETFDKQMGTADILIKPANSTD